MSRTQMERINSDPIFHQTSLANQDQGRHRATFIHQNPLSQYFSFQRNSNEQLRPFSIISMSTHHSSPTLTNTNNSLSLSLFESSILSSPSVSASGPSFHHIVISDHSTQHHPSIHVSHVSVVHREEHNVVGKHRPKTSDHLMTSDSRQSIIHSISPVYVYVTYRFCLNHHRLIVIVGVVASF